MPEATAFPGKRLAHPFRGSNLRYVPKRHDSVFSNAVKIRPYFNWRSASRGCSAVAELLVNANGKQKISLRRTM